MRTILALMIAALVIGLSSCVQRNMELVTKKIQYDVNIQSPEPDYDWWIQNLVGPDREKLVDLIMDGALEGKFQAYDYFNQPLTPAAIRAMLSDTVLMRYRQIDPPYETFDSMVVYRIERSDIQRIRFLESWEMDPSTLEMNKHIYGLAPIARRTEYGDKVQWQPLFWVYTDNDFLASQEP